MLGRPLCAVGPVNSGVRVVSLVDLLVMTTRAALRAAFGAVIPGASTHQVWGPGVRGIPASFAPKSLECRWKGDDASPGGGHDSMRGLPEMRTPIVEEESIPATEDELAKRRAAALRAWLEREMGTERAALTALLAKHGVKMKVRHPTPQSSRLSPDTNSNLIGEPSFSPHLVLSFDPSEPLFPHHSRRVALRKQSHLWKNSCSGRLRG